MFVPLPFPSPFSFVFVFVLFCFPRFLSWWTVPVPISKLKGKYIQNQCTPLSPPHPPSRPCLPPSLPRTGHTPALQGPLPASPWLLQFLPFLGSLPEPAAHPGLTCRAVLQRLLRAQAPSPLLAPPGQAPPPFSVPPRQLNSGDRAGCLCTTPHPAAQGAGAGDAGGRSVLGGTV